jgi:hypothetical protein
MFLVATDGRTDDCRQIAKRLPLGSDQFGTRNAETLHQLVFWVLRRGPGRMATLKE